MNEFKLKYSITEAEFMEAYEAHWKSNKQATLSNLTIGGIGVIAGLVLNLYIALYGLILTAAGLILISLPLVRKYLHIRAYRESAKYKNEIEVMFTDEQIEVKTSDGHSKLNWSVYSNYLDTQNFFLLYLSPRVFSIIPKKALTEATDGFIPFVKNKISQQKV